MKHTEVVNEWISGRKATGSRMFTDGKVIYSYGEHFPIAVFLNDDEVLYNNDKYSSSTSKHQNYVLNQISSSYIKIFYCTTHKIKKYINTGKVVIETVIQPQTMNELNEIIKTYFKSQGIKRYPEKKIKQFFVSKLTALKV